MIIIIVERAKQAHCDVKNDSIAQLQPDVPVP